MSEHTPGPWRIGGARYYGGGWHVYVYTDTEDAETIAKLHDYETKEERANARLIAAAPDLLEACEDMWALIQALNSISPMNAINEKKARDSLIEKLAQMEAAIAKAREK